MNETYYMQRRRELLSKMENIHKEVGELENYRSELVGHRLDIPTLLSAADAFMYELNKEMNRQECILGDLEVQIYNMSNSNENVS